MHYDNASNQFVGDSLNISGRVFAEALERLVHGGVRVDRAYRILSDEKFWSMTRKVRSRRRKVGTVDP
jgi:hypothetical protein